MTFTPRYWLLGAFALAPIALQTACPSPDARSETIEPTTLPQEVRADYEVFAQRCSKCHSLSRPLNSGIVDDEYWALYVARMRRQPSSGISVEDSRVILRFLHYYSLEQIRKKQAHEAHETPPQPPAGQNLPAGDAGTSSTGTGDAG
jgi:hypothetical protein